MITSTSSSDRAPRPDAVAASDRQAIRPPKTRSDQLSTESAAFLRSELLRQPEIRPEVIQRARALLADPTYPPPAVIRNLAQLILGAPDRSEDES